MVEVYDAPGDCPLRGNGQHGDEVRLGPAAREHLRARQRPGGAFAVHSRGATPRRAARADRPFGHARAEPRRGRGRDPGDVSLTTNAEANIKHRTNLMIEDSEAVRGYGSDPGPL
jgi:hypothetical protein